MDSRRESGRRLRQKERKHYTDDCLEDEEIEGRRMFSVEEKLVSNKFKSDFVKEMSGLEFSLKYLQEKSFSHPVVFKEKTGLGIRMPTQNFTVNDVRQCVGSRRVIDVMDTETQTDTQMTMKEWCKYYENKEQRTRLLNVISLEFSHTRLENYVESPTFVRQVDWSDVAWPRFLKESQVESTNRIEDMKYPKVQKYCLMSVKGCYTDFHVDFGGTSVWYHILHGKKVFWLIPPTERNLSLYEQWVLSGKQGDVFFGDQVEKCARIKLEAGYTFLIPSGWIHAVFTPEDSLVFGGNFLHTFGAANQLRISAIEDATHVQQKFRYPFFTELHWYVLQQYVFCLMGKWHLTCNEDGESLTKTTKKIKVQKDDRFSEESAGSYITPPVSPRDFKDSSFRESDDKENMNENKKINCNLTKYELNGLKMIFKWLKSNQRGRKCVPELIKDHEALLKDVEELISKHENDDPILAITGIPIIHWSDSSKNKYKPRGHFQNVKTPTPNKANGGNNSTSVRRRRTRCKKCDACLRNDCGECHYCKDMRKFGGPGRMKQSCIARQCMAPVLPHTASCLLCGKDGCDKMTENEPESTSLMECSQCWEILHPDCINAKYPGIEANINEDLPNSWECPKCVLKTEATGSSGAVKPRSLKKYKLPSDSSNFLRADSMDESSNNSMDNYVDNNSKEHIKSYDNRFLTDNSAFKRRSDDFSDVQKKIKAESKDVSNGPTFTTLFALSNNKSCDDLGGNNGESKDKTMGSVNDSEQAMSPSHVRSCSRNANIRSVSVLNNKSAISSTLSAKNKTSNGKVSANPSRHVRLSLLNSRERLVKRMKGLKKSSSESVLRTSVNSIMRTPARLKRLPTTSSSLKNGNVSSQESSLNASSKPSSHLSPKVEKVSDASHKSPAYTKPSPPINDDPSKNNTNPDTDESEAEDKPSDDVTHQEVKIKKEERKVPSSPSNQRGLRDRSAIKRPRFVVRPAPIVQEVEKKSGRGRHSKKYHMERNVMLKVLKHLTPGDLFNCQLVCKTWNSWCVDPSLWEHMEVSRCKLTSMHLIGIVRRQPLSLDLSWTNISRKQLSWLISRLPQTRKLSLAGCSWAAVSALCSAECPLLTSLDLNWVEGMCDNTIRDLLAKPPSSTLRPGFIENKTRCRNLTEIKLAGADISDMSVRLLVQHLSVLSNFSISQCRKITDMGIAVLATAKTLKLVKLDVSGCVNVSDTSLESLKRCVNLIQLDMRECPQVSRSSCGRFLLHNRSRFAMKEERFFVKVR